MKRKQLLPGLGASLGMIILIFDGKTALAGAQSGIELCLKTVIPSLFPFFVLSILLTSSLNGISIPGLLPLGQLCGVPKGAESILISGFLGGYPVGAQCISAIYSDRKLPREEAERLLAFCNNAGPAFLFGIIANMFPNRWMTWALWGIHIAGAIFAALLIRGEYSGTVHISASHANITLSGALYSAIRVMASVCGWVVLFRIAIAFMKRWVLWLFQTNVQVVLIGLLELSNGCCELLAVSDIPMRFLLCSGMLAFGGLCVTMQTVSVVKGLSLRYYFLGKLVQTLFSLTASVAIMFNIWLPCIILLIVFLIILFRKEKNSSIQAAVGV